MTQNNADEPQNNVLGSDVLEEANLWNPLWVYDLFPTVQSSWNRMPIIGADFETESSAGGREQSKPSDVRSEDSSGSETGDAEPDEQQENNSGSGGDKDYNNDEPENEDEGNEGGDEPEPGDDLFDEDGNPIDEDEEADAEAGNDDEDKEQSEPGDLGSENPESQDEQDGNSNNDGNPGDGPRADGTNEYHLEGPKSGTPLPIPGLTIIRTDTGTEYFREFNSWDEFVECVADESLYAWKHVRASHDPNQGTAGAAASFTEAVEMARFRGWPEGRNLLTDLMANITTKNEAFEIWDLDVAGIFPIVPAFLSGDPACMIVDPMNELRTQYPIIRIDYNHEVAWHITPKDMMTRGAAILSLANNLEAHGFQTELRIVGNSTGIQYSHSSSKIETITFKYSIVYKKPGQFLDIDRAAFAIAHPACFRRLGFALLEQHAELEASFSSNYGSPTYAPVDPNAGDFGTIFVAGSKGNETEEKSRKVVMEAAEITTSTIKASEGN